MSGQRCGCPSGLGYRFHRFPCSRAGEIEPNTAPRVHNHPPYRPVCNERRLLDGQLRGACLNDDGSER